MIKSLFLVLLNKFSTCRHEHCYWVSYRSAGAMHCSNKRIRSAVSIHAHPNIHPYPIPPKSVHVPYVVLSTTTRHCLPCTSTYDTGPHVNDLLGAFQVNQTTFAHIPHLLTTFPVSTDSLLSSRSLVCLGHTQNAQNAPIVVF